MTPFSATVAANSTFTVELCRNRLWRIGYEIQRRIYIHSIAERNSQQPINQTVTSAGPLFPLGGAFLAL